MNRRVRNLIVSTTFAAGCALLGAAFLGGSTGCQGQQCQGEGLEFGVREGEGNLATPDIWESTPQVSPWLDFPHQRTWYFRLRGLEGRTILRAFVYISPDKEPNKTGSQYTLASGNLARITILDSGTPGVTPLAVIQNDTCAEFYVRVVVEAYPGPPGGGPPPDAGEPDAAVDSSFDTGATE